MLVLVSALLPLQGYAFGAQAHRVVGHIATENLCVGARAELHRILPATDLAEAGLWADRIRAEPGWDVARPWHYMNVPDDVPIATAEGSRAGDVLSAIRLFGRQLDLPELSADERRVAVYFLVHFVADIHQPMHVGRAEDKGGNLTPIRIEGGREGNLHNYWDTIVLRGLRDPYRYAAELNARYADRIPDWLASEPLAWATESQRLRAQAYDFAVDSDGMGRLDAAYEAAAQEIVGERLAQAGIRLAGLLNARWCGRTGAAEAAAGKGAGPG